MSEVDEAVRGMSGTAATTLQVTMTMVEQQARRRAERLRRIGAESEQARQRARQALKAEADAQAARWAVLARTGPDWIDGYASAVEWRELDPRAAEAVDRIEDGLRRAGVDVPETAGIREHNLQSAAAVGIDTDAPGAENAQTPDPEEQLVEDYDKPGPEETHSKIGVTMTTQPAAPPELGQAFHPTGLNPSTRRQVGGRRKAQRPKQALNQPRNHPGRSR